MMKLSYKSVPFFLFFLMTIMVASCGGPLAPPGGNLAPAGGNDIEDTASDDGEDGEGVFTPLFTTVGKSTSVHHSDSFQAVITLGETVPISNEFYSHSFDLNNGLELTAEWEDF